MLLQLLIFAVGMAVLTFGAELLVKGSSRLAAAFGVSPLLVGLTVVAFGTSAPEMAVSVGAVLQDQPDLAIGNVVGSNVFNVLVILGLSALVAPLAVDRQLIRWDVPVMVGASLLVWLVCADQSISRMEGGVLFGLLLAYIGWSIWRARSDSTSVDAAAEAVPRRPLRDGLLILAGLALLVAGSEALLGAAVAIARGFGISELVIGLTIVAAGTSLPELATSVLATLRGQREIAVGNVIGSNIFNMFGVLGLSALVADYGLPVAKAALAVDIPVMVAVAIACLPIFFTRLISRHEGATLLALYVVYATYLVLDARHHRLEDELTTVVVYGVLPATVLVLAIAFRDGLQRRRHSRPSNPDGS